MVYKEPKSSFVMVVKEKQCLDPTMVGLKEAVLRKFVDSFSQERNSVLRYQGRLCVPNINDLK